MPKLGFVELMCMGCSQEEILLMARVRSPALSPLIMAPMTNATPLASKLSTAMMNTLFTIFPMSLDVGNVGTVPSERHVCNSYQYIFCVCAKRYVQFSQDYHTVVDIQSIISIVYKYGSISFSCFLVPQKISGQSKSTKVRFCVSYFESNIPSTWN